MGGLSRRLRWLVVWSSRGRLEALYRGIYGAIIGLVTMVFRRYPSVVAVYLASGAAKDGVRPGVSDVDLLVVVADDSEIDAVRRAFRALGRATGGLVEQYPNVVQTLAALRQRWQTAPAWRHRYRVGQAGWTLLLGADVLADLPELDAMQRRAGCLAEMNRWWLLFAHQVLESTPAQRDVVMANSVCYKAVSEVINAERTLDSGELCFRRAEALDGDASPLAGWLRDTVARRFLAADPALLDATFGFLVARFVARWRAFDDRPFVVTYPDRRPRVDCPAGEVVIGAAEARHLRALDAHVAAWGAVTHVVKSASHGLDDLLWIVDVADLPSVRQLAALGDRHRAGRRQLRQPIHLFLRVGPVAFPLSPSLPRDLHRGLLTAITAPDVFLQLGADAADVRWSEHARWFLCDWRSNQQWPDLSEPKRRQLEAIARGAAAGDIVYPLTAQALRRCTSG